MNKNEKRWHWIFTGEEFDFVDNAIPFGAIRYIHNWKKKDEYAMHKHSFTEIVIVLRGKAMHILKTRNNEISRCIISKGSVIIINPEEEHTFELLEEEELEIINLDFKASFVDQKFKQSDTEVCLLDFIYQQPLLPLKMRFENNLKLNRAELKFITLQTKNFEKENKRKYIGFRLLLGFIMSEMLMVISRKYIEIIELGECYNDDINKDISYMSRVKGYIENNYTKKISKKELSRIGMCSERQLSRKFKQYTGITIVKFINKIRIEKAKIELIETKNTITDIVEITGFSNISYFNKVFITYEGMTPSAYREKHLIH